MDRRYLSPRLDQSFGPMGRFGLRCWENAVLERYGHGWDYLTGTRAKVHSEKCYGASFKSLLLFKSVTAAQLLKVSSSVALTTVAFNPRSSTV